MVTGYDLLATLQYQATELEYYKTQEPVACPNDGEPLRGGPPNRATTLYCPFCHFRVPRDWDVDAHSGM